MRPLKHLAITAGLLAGLLLLGCATWLGPAETPGQKAFKAAGDYVYVATPVQVYAALPTAKPDVLAALGKADQVAYETLQAAIAAYEAGADNVSAGLVTAAKGLEVFSALVLGGAANLPDDPLELGARTVVLAAVGLRGANAMRVHRKGYLVPKLETFATEGRDPTWAELDEIKAKAAAIHSAIQGGASPA